MAWQKFTPVLKVRAAGSVSSRRPHQAGCLLACLPPELLAQTPSLPPPLPSLRSAQEIETRRVQPELYPYGSRGPLGAHYLAAKYGVRWGDLAGDDE